jgi:hypothetical protein
MANVVPIAGSAKTTDQKPLPPIVDNTSATIRRGQAPFGSLSNTASP